MAFFIQSNLNLEVIAPHKKTTIVQFKKESGLNSSTTYNTIQKDVIQENIPSFMSLNKSLVVNVDGRKIELKKSTFNRMTQSVFNNGLCELGGIISTSKPIFTNIDYSRKIRPQNFDTLTCEVLQKDSLSTLHIYIPYTEEQVQNIISNAKQTQYSPLFINVKKNTSVYFFRECGISSAFESKNVYKPTTMDSLDVHVKKNTQNVFLYDNIFSLAEEHNDSYLKHETEHETLVVAVNSQEMIEEQRTVFNDLVMYVDTITEDANIAKTFSPLNILVEGSTSSSVGDSTGLETLNIEMQKNVFCRYTYKFTDTYIASISGLPSGMSYNQQSIFGSVKVAGTYACVMSLQNGNDIGLTIRISEIKRLQ